MRSIAKFSNENEARRFSFFLKKEKIANELDIDGNSFSLWVEDEDDIVKAQNFFNEWKLGKLQLPEIKVEEAPAPEIDETKEDSLEDEAESLENEEESLEDEELLEEEIQAPKKAVQQPSRKHFVLTSFFFLVCAIFYLLSLYQTFDVQSKGVFLDTPVQNALLYDNPAALNEVNQYLMEHPYDPSKKLQEQPPQMQEALKEREQIPIWRGFEVSLDKKSLQRSLAFPTFEKIRQGQIWRLISPSFFHQDFFHILFNMLWLWMLGKQIESRLSKIKYFVLVLILGVFTNTLQYLMTGPFFLGYSGVIMGLVGFIWMRQKVAPWEGYPLSKTTMLFIAFFVLALFAFQFFSLGLEVVGVHLLSTPIANTAHISGGILGIILGRLSFFSRRPCER